VAGGAGLAAPINCTTYAAGGKGMADSSPGSSGSANTGNGGDGGGNPNCAGAGGSGIVVVKELNKASGVWNLKSQLAAKQQGTWPRVLFALNCASIMVIGGGGGAPAAPSGGGAGAGGMALTPSCVSIISNLECGSVDITIGGGGTGGAIPPRPANGFAGTLGNDSYIGSSVPEALLVGYGGGAGGTPDSFQACNPNLVDVGGSGGGGVGEGNTPGGTNPGGCSTQAPSMPAPLQPFGFGNAGGSGTACSSSPDRQSGGGGGAGGAGTPSAAGGQSCGGAGKDVTPIFGAGPQPYYIPNGANAGPSVGGIFAGGGAGRQCSSRSPGNGGAGGPGGGGDAFNNANGNGVANTGGGGGAGFGPAPNPSPSGPVSAYVGGNGGSGYVLIRVPNAQAPAGFAVGPGCNSIVCAPGCTQVAVFKVSGTLTIS
jgi:hypothetical protein